MKLFTCILWDDRTQHTRQAYYIQKQLDTRQAYYYIQKQQLQLDAAPLRHHVVVVPARVLWIVIVLYD